jgi:hypothetical protein
MAGRQAKTIAPVQQELLLQHVRGRKDVLRSRVEVGLRFEAGLIKPINIFGAPSYCLEHLRLSIWKEGLR